MRAGSCLRRVSARANVARGRVLARVQLPRAGAGAGAGAALGVFGLGLGVGALGGATAWAQAQEEPPRAALPPPPPPSPPPSEREEVLEALRQINGQLSTLEERLGVGPEADADHVIVVGAGLVGSLIACIMRAKGWRVTVYERYADIRTIPSTGRSINLVITSRGLRAVDALGGGLTEEVEQMSTKVTHRTIHQTDGEIMFQRYGKDDSEYNNSISRYELNKHLIQKAEQAGAVIHFNRSLVQADFHVDEQGQATGSTLTFSVRAEGGGEEQQEVVHAQCPVIACDGGGSGVRRALVAANLTSASEELLSQGYKEVLFPKTVSASEGSDEKVPTPLVEYGLHIWPRAQHMVMALANLDGSFTGTIYMEKDGPESFAALTDEDKASAFYNKYYPTAVPLIGGMGSAAGQLANNPVGILGTVRTEKWHVGGSVLLIGDAAHAIVPFFGQGCNCGFEDCAELSRLVDQHCKVGDRAATDWETCFAALEVARKTNANAIADMALENYDEMQEKCGDRGFLLRKAVENKIEQAHQDKFRSRYAMVVYGGAGNITYRNAYTLGAVQWEILDELCADITDPEQVDMGRALQLIDERLRPVQEELGIDLSTVSH